MIDKTQLIKFRDIFDLDDGFAHKPQHTKPKRYKIPQVAQEVNSKKETHGVFLGALDLSVASRQLPYLSVTA